VDEIKVGFAFWLDFLKRTLSDYPNLQQQRQQLLQQLSGLQELRRGSLTEQFLALRRNL